MAKIIADALNGIAYRDDTQIVSLQVEKWYSEIPHTVVTLRALTEDECMRMFREQDEWEKTHMAWVLDGAGYPESEE